MKRATESSSIFALEMLRGPFPAPCESQPRSRRRLVAGVVKRFRRADFVVRLRGPDRRLVDFRIGGGRRRLLGRGSRRRGGWNGRQFGFRLVGLVLGVRCGRERRGRQMNDMPRRRRRNRGRRPLQRRRNATRPVDHLVAAHRSSAVGRVPALVRTAAAVRAIAGQPHERVARTAAKRLAESRRGATGRAVDDAWTAHAARQAKGRESEKVQSHSRCLMSRTITWNRRAGSSDLKGSAGESGHGDETLRLRKTGSCCEPLCRLRGRRNDAGKTKQKS